MRFGEIPIIGGHIDKPDKIKNEKDSGSKRPASIC